MQVAVASALYWPKQLSWPKQYAGLAAATVSSGKEAIGRSHRCEGKSVSFPNLYLFPFRTD
eukprot:scaffold374693_cov22-Prasinocladus_malaysianus.AAC.1